MLIHLAFPVALHTLFVLQMGVYILQWITNILPASRNGCSNCSYNIDQMTCQLVWE